MGLTLVERLVGTGGQYLHAISGDGQRVFPLCRQAAVTRGYGLAIFLVEFGLLFSRVDHGFNGEGHAFL